MEPTPTPVPGLTAAQGDQLISLVAAIATQTAQASAQQHSDALGLWEALARPGAGVLILIGVILAYMILRVIWATIRDVVTP